jgi:hypothetical protein
MKPLKRGALVALVVAAGTVSWFFSLNVKPTHGTRADHPELPQQHSKEAPDANEVAQPEVAVKRKEIKGDVVSSPTTALPSLPKGLERPVISGLQLHPEPLPWEIQLKEVKSRGLDPTGAAKAILGLLAYLPEEALETAVQEAMEQIPDQGWRAVALPLLLNPQTHGRVQSVLFADMMERPKTVSLPSLLEVASTPAHPLAAFALDDLKLFLGENFKVEDTTSETILQFLKEKQAAIGNAAIEKTGATTSGAPE